MRCTLQLKLFLSLTLLIMLLVGAACYATYSFSAAALRDALVLTVQSEAPGGALPAEKDHRFAPLKALGQKTLGVAVLAALLGALSVFLILRSPLKALKACAGFARGIADGASDRELGIRRRDEMGMLADALREISAHLRDLVSQYRNLARELIYGEIEIRGDAAGFSGAYAALVENVNALLSRYQLILNALTSPVIVLDKETRITYMNDVARKIGGENYRGKACREIMRREDDSTPNDALMRAVQSLRSAKGETVAHPLGKSLDISYTAVPFTDPESGGLSSALQLITDLTEIKSTQRVMQEVANRATGIAERVASASAELADQVEQVSNGTQAQRDQASSTATAMEEMNAAALEVARNASQARVQANTMSDKARDGARLVDEVIAAINQVDVVAKALETTMQELGRQAENIGGVMVVISDIADQTNLLALNAAIEAARAGEAGRGFAVVASEVRKLAEKTMTATNEVGNSIQGIQNASTSSMARVAEAAEKTGQAAGLVGSSGAALEEILTFADSTSELITGIASAVEQQSATSEEINRAVDEISGIAKKTAQGMVQSAAAVQELSAMSQELKRLLGKLRRA